MDVTDNPYTDLAHDALGHLCAQRAEALQARGWRDEAERDALREETARLLRVVACRLGAGVHLHEDTPLAGEALRDYLATRVEHQPLSARAATRHRAPDEDPSRQA